MKSLFTGICVALVTPFRNNKIDYCGLNTLLQKCIAEKVDAIAILATTGEGSTISSKDKTKVIKYCREKVPYYVKLIVGTGNNDFAKAYEETLVAKKLGADGVLVVTPYYNKTTQEGIVEYYKKLNEIELPIICYNVPSRTGLNIELPTLKNIIKQCPFVYGIKESTCDIVRIIELIKICKNKIAVYSGEDNLNFLFYVMGAQGSVSVTANAFCKEVKRVFALTQKQETKKAFALQSSLQKIGKLLFLETNPTPIKSLLCDMGYITDEVRMPLITPSVRLKKQLSIESKKLLKRYRYEHQ